MRLNGEIPYRNLGGTEERVSAIAISPDGATLATWFGVAAPDLPTVFPLIGNFGSTNLGFMGTPGSTC